MCLVTVQLRTEWHVTMSKDSMISGYFIIIMLGRANQSGTHYKSSSLVTLVKRHRSLVLLLRFEQKL
jgi:hypothetical protein